MRSSTDQHTMRSYPYNSIIKLTTSNRGVEAGQWCEKVLRDSFFEVSYVYCGEYRALMTRGSKRKPSFSPMLHPPRKLHRNAWFNVYFDATTPALRCVLMILQAFPASHNRYCSAIAPFLLFRQCQRACVAQKARKPAYMMTAPKIAPATALPSSGSSVDPIIECDPLCSDHISSLPRALMISQRRPRAVKRV